MSVLGPAMRFRFGELSIGGRVIETIEHAQAPVVVVHQDHFVVTRIHGDGAVDRILVADGPNRRSSDDARLTGRLGARMDGAGSKRRCFLSKCFPAI